jgi:hypothetical protein
MRIHGGSSADRDNHPGVDSDRSTRRGPAQRAAGDKPQLAVASERPRVAGVVEDLDLRGPDRAVAFEWEPPPRGIPANRGLALVRCEKLWDSGGVSDSRGEGEADEYASPRRGARERTLSPQSARLAGAALRVADARASVPTARAVHPPPIPGLKRAEARRLWGREGSDRRATEREPSARTPCGQADSTEPHLIDT